MSTTPIEDPEYDFCLWPVDPACKTEEWLALPEADRERGLALASSTLWRLSGYRVGGCPITVRPCKRGCAPAGIDNWWTGSNWTPHIDIGGRWVNSCGCRTDCACGSLCEIQLPPPIGEVISVDINGIDYTADVTVQGDRLVYTGTEDCPFPACQDLAAPPGSPDTFTVTYRNSYPVDGLGSYAVGVLALEYAKACSGAKCALPKGVTQITRQGVSMEIISGAFPGGYTGIQQVDAWIALWRPEGSPTRAPVMWAPGMSRPRVERR